MSTGTSAMTMVILTGTGHPVDVNVWGPRTYNGAKKDSIVQLHPSIVRRFVLTDRSILDREPRSFQMNARSGQAAGRLPGSYILCCSEPSMAIGPFQYVFCNRQYTFVNHLQPLDSWGDLSWRYADMADMRNFIKVVLFHIQE